MVITSLSDILHGRLRRRLPGFSTMRFFSTGLRFLQNSSIKQKISIKFAVVMGMDVFV